MCMELNLENRWTLSIRFAKVQAEVTKQEKHCIFVSWSLSFLIKQGTIESLFEVSLSF